GLRTIELDKEIKLAPHQRFSIVASVKNDKNDAKIKFSDEEFSNLDLSYVNRDNQWVISQKLFGGVARIKVFTRNNYKNTDSKNLLSDITNASVSFDKPKYRYGMQTEAKPKVMFNGEILKENIDYTVDYSYFYDETKKVLYNIPPSFLRFKKFLKRWRKGKPFGLPPFFLHFQILTPFSLYSS
ncbi:hypothetical protein, partial [Ureaplasma zalophigenitalium]